MSDPDQPESSRRGGREKVKAEGEARAPPGEDGGGGEPEPRMLCCFWDRLVAGDS